MGQVQDEAVGLALHPADDHQGLAEVALSVARRMGQGHEHLLGLTAMLPDVVLDDGVSAVEPVLVPEPLEDALGRVALLPGDLMVLFEDPVNDARKGLQLGAPGCSLPPVTRRNGVGHHFPYSVPVQPEHPGGLPNAQTLHHHRPADPQIRFHLVHP